MKKLILKMSATCLSSLLISGAAAAASSIYTETRNNVHPLSTYEQCSLRSNYGFGAYLAAKNAALIACDLDSNLDCVEVGVIFREYVSTEFVGYKTCSATVRVRGWK